MCAPWIVGFIRGRWVHSGASSGSLGSSVSFCSCGCALGRWVHSGAQRGSFGFSGVVRFTWVHPGFFGVIRFCCVHSCAPRWSLGSFGCALVVVGYFHGRWVLLGAHWVSLGSSGVFGFTRVRPRGRWVHPGSFGSLGCALGVVCFIRDRWVHSGAPRGSVGSSRVVRFI